MANWPSGYGPLVKQECKVGGVEVADVVKAPALVVCIDPAGVRVPGVVATKMDVGKAPCTEGAPMIQPGPEWKTSS